MTSAASRCQGPSPRAWAVAVPAVMSLLACAVLLLAGCASLPGATTVPVQGRSVECIVSRHDGPTVVFESGLNGTLDGWAKVWPEIAREHAAIACNRPGYGHSSAQDGPLDAVQQVAQLRSVLQAQQLAPPYVLVGHSLGGLYQQWFARRHPEEVAALVLVDATHPQQLRGAGAPEQWPWLGRTALRVLTSSTAQREFASLDASGQQVLALPPPPAHVPVWVLSALGPMAVRSPLADDSNAKRVALAGLYPGATQVWVDSGHHIPLERPEAVVAAIRSALAAAAPAVPAVSTQAPGAGD